MGHPLLPEWVILVSVLLLKSVTQSSLQVWVRIRYQLYATGEDKKLFYRFRKKGAFDKSDGEGVLQRYTKLWQNDLESIPFFLIVALGYTLIGGDESWGVVYFSIFALARISYSFCYIKGVQPGRGMSWDVATMAMLAITIHSLVIALPLVSF